MRLLLFGFLLSSTFVAQQLVAQEPVRAVVPSPVSAHANRFYSPGVDHGENLKI